MSLPPNESCSSLDEDIVIYSRPFGIELHDLLCRDRSYTHCPAQFQNAFAALEHSLVKQCFFAAHSEEPLSESVMRTLQEKGKVEVSLLSESVMGNEKSFRLGLTCVTWMGDRLLT